MAAAYFVCHIGPFFRYLRFVPSLGVRSPCISQITPQHIPSALIAVAVWSSKNEWLPESVANINNNNRLQIIDLLMGLRDFWMCRPRTRKMYYSLSALKWHKSNIKNLSMKSSELCISFYLQAPCWSIWPTWGLSQDV